MGKGIAVAGMWAGVAMAVFSIVPHDPKMAGLVGAFGFLFAAISSLGIFMFG